jgi:hypothetical protein
VIGGAKVKDKIKVLHSLIHKAEVLCIGEITNLRVDSALQGWRDAGRLFNLTASSIQVFMLLC